MIFLSSCYVGHWHYFGEEPKRPGIYPEFTSEDSLAGYLDGDLSSYDVFFYDIEIDVDPFVGLSGKVNMYFQPVEKIGGLRFDLYEDLDIHRVDFNGKNLAVQRNSRACYILFPDSLEKDVKYSIAIDYSGSPGEAKDPPWEGGIVWGADTALNPFAGVCCQSEGASIWLPCKDHLSDEPDSVRMTISVPDGLTAVSNGTMVDHFSGDGKEVYTWFTQYPVNPYNITFYIGDYVNFKDTLDLKEGKLLLDYYVLPGNLERAKRHFKQSRDVVRIYSELFGPYPWIEEGFRLVESPYEGMEHQTAIAFGYFYMNHPGWGFDYIIVHEAAHEWWGNAVSVSDFSDIWIHEGFATYAEFLFIERIENSRDARYYARVEIAPFINNKRPVVGPGKVNYWSHDDNDVYNKGAMVLHTLRNAINDSILFFDILQTFYRDHAKKSNVTTRDFIELVNEKTGKNWDKFFEAYLYTTKVPVLHYYFYSEGVGPGAKGSTYNLALKWENVPEGFSMPISVLNTKTKKITRFDASTSIKFYNTSIPDSISSLPFDYGFSYYVIEEDSSLLYEQE